jgi:hypothetical protein
MPAVPAGGRAVEPPIAGGIVPAPAVVIAVPVSAPSGASEPHATPANKAHATAVEQSNFIIMSSRLDGNTREVTQLRTTVYRRDTKSKQSLTDVFNSAHVVFGEHVAAASLCHRHREIGPAMGL